MVYISLALPLSRSKTRALTKWNSALSHSMSIVYVSLSRLRSSNQDDRVKLGWRCGVGTKIAVPIRVAKGVRVF